MSKPYLYKTSYPIKCSYNQPCFLTKHVLTIFIQDIISHKVLSTWLWPAGTSLAAVCKSCPNLCSVRHQQFCFACTDNSIQRVSCSTASGDQHRHQRELQPRPPKCWQREEADAATSCICSAARGNNPIVSLVQILPKMHGTRVLLLKVMVFDIQQACIACTAWHSMQLTCFTSSSSGSSLYLNQKVPGSSILSGVHVCCSSLSPSGRFTCPEPASQHVRQLLLCLPSRLLHSRQAHALKLPLHGYAVPCCHTGYWVAQQVEQNRTQSHAVLPSVSAA